MNTWRYAGDKIDINFADGVEEVDINEFRWDHGWKLLGAHAHRNVK